MNELVKINSHDLQVKELNGKRIVTFKDIDFLHERAEGTAKRNFAENKIHFLEGIDYFIVKPSDFEKYEFRTLEIPNRGLTLITESGYLMLVKSLQDNLAWKVQRELVNSYFRVKYIDPYEGLSKELKAVFVLDKKTQEIKTRINHLEDNMPLFNIECKELQSLVRKVATKVLGGYRSPAYCNNSIRCKVYADVQNQLKRQFGVNRYEAIKRKQLKVAKDILKEYKVALVLENQIEYVNSQIAI